MVQEEFKAFKYVGRVVVVPFNPWFFQDQPQLIRSFFASVAEALRQSLETKGEKAARVVKEYGQLLDPFLKLMPFPVPDLGKTAELFGPSTFQLEDLRKRLEQLLIKQECRIVVVIDDIDRLDQEEIQAVFKLVKLCANFARTDYILAFDDTVITSALAVRYGGSSQRGQSYLEKIVQVPLYLPMPDHQELRKMALEGIDEALHLAAISLSKHDREDFNTYFELGLYPAINTPRMAKRYANALLIALPILKGEVHPIDLLLIEGLRVAYPALYNAIRDNPPVFLQRPANRLDIAYGDAAAEAKKKRDSKVLANALDGLSWQHEQAAKTIVKRLFPQVSVLLGGNSHGESVRLRWSEEQRIASESYFSRYFQYAVPSHDITDQPIRAFIEAIDSLSPTEIARELHRLCNEHEPVLVLEKLSTFEDIPQRASRLNSSHTTIVRFLEGLAIFGAALPPDMDTSFRTPRDLTIGIIYRQIRDIGQQTIRDQVAEKVLEQCSDLGFRVNLWQMLETTSDSAASHGRLLSLEQDQHLGGSIAQLVAEQAAIQPLHQSLPRHEAIQFYAEWARWTAPNVAEQYLSSTLAVQAT
jgi:predicted KAP-like P-loop ATPase